MADPVDGAPPARLAPFPEDWSRALAVVAHPDDMEYGAAAAVARWTGQGKWVGYVLITDGEAGIAAMAPAAAGPLRRAEQVAGCAEVGVTTVEFAGLADGTLVEDLSLRAVIAGAIRRHRPDVVLSINFHDSWGAGTSWNHADHRAVGRALLDAVRDAANPWVFPEQGEPFGGVRLAAFNASPHATHAVDVTDTFDAGVRSLACHRVYLDNLGGALADPEAFLRTSAEAAGPTIGARMATTFEIIT
jgi:LmbE family N-acetylglucosaminyl deacetylase